MDERGLLQSQVNGQECDSTLLNGLTPVFPTLNSAVLDGNGKPNLYAHLRHSIGGGRVRTLILLGDYSDPNLANLTGTQRRRNGLKPLAVTINDATNNGWGTVPLLTWPKAKVVIHNALFKGQGLGGGATGSSSTGIPTTWAGSLAIGSAASTTYVSPMVTTKQDILAPITISAATASVATISGSGAGTFSALTDSTGGTTSTTLASITAGASYAQADMTAAKNAIASLNAQVNLLAGAILGTNAPSSSIYEPSHGIDGTSTALTANLNLDVTTEAGGGVVYIDGRLYIDWSYATLP